MKAHFLKLFDYDFKTNQTMIDIAQHANVTEKAIQITAHIFAAKQVWLHRVNNEPPATGFVLWPDWPLNTFTEKNHELHKEWLLFLNEQDDFDQVVNYKNLQGQPFAVKLIDILTHIVNHGTHHRAQIGQQLKLAGLEKLPVTDYIYYSFSNGK